jgi:hypothetical protein
LWKKERKEFYTEDAENTEGTEKIEAEKAMCNEKEGTALPERRAEDQSRE